METEGNISLMELTYFSSYAELTFRIYLQRSDSIYKVFASCEPIGFNSCGVGATEPPSYLVV